MLLMLCNKKGIGLIEVLVAILLTTMGVLALLSLQNPGWRNMSKADYVGRASGILYRTLENKETLILNPCNIIPLGTETKTFYTSDQTASITGDLQYTVKIVTTDDGASTEAFVVTVTVTWPPVNNTGISESMTVSRQELNRFPAGCTNDSLNVNYGTL